MRYLVAVKQVPSTDDVQIDENGSLRREGVPSVLNPYDELALMSVLDIRQEGDRVSVVTMGPPQAEAALRRCLELGADDAFLITGNEFAGADTWATSRVLAAFVSRYACDAGLIVFGRQATDGDTGQVPYETAWMLDAQQFAYVTGLKPTEDGLVAEQDYSDTVRTVRVPKGSVVAFANADPNGTFPTVSGWLSSRGKEIVKVGRVDLGLGAYSVGLKGSKTKIVSTQKVTAARRNRKVEINDPAYAAEFIIGQLEGSR